MTRGYSLVIEGVSMATAPTRRNSPLFRDRPLLRRRTDRTAPPKRFAFTGKACPVSLKVDRSGKLQNLFAEARQDELIAPIEPPEKPASEPIQPLPNVGIIKIPGIAIQEVAALRVPSGSRCCSTEASTDRVLPRHWKSGLQLPTRRYDSTVERDHLRRP